VKQTAISIGVCLILVVGIYFAIGGRGGIVAAVIPDFPDWPAPVTTLDADSSGQIYFESITPVDFDVLLGDPSLALKTTAVGTLTLPEGASKRYPAPAMVIVHGSGGQLDIGENAAKLLAETGIASFVIDYYRPRGVTDETPYMVKVVTVTEFDAISDSYAALKLLSTHPLIDARHIGIMGFSYGGMAARLAMDDRFREILTPDHPGFAAYVDFYGPCFQVLGTRATNGAPLLTLRGSEDRSNDLAACAKREDELRALGVNVEAHVYDGAGHAWGASRPRSVIEAPYVVGCEVVYDERGHSFLDGETPILDVALETSREDRIAVRTASGTAMSKCVEYDGYIVGRDDETQARSEADLLSFVRRTLLADRPIPLQ